jgi:hypothetical protein
MYLINLKKIAMRYLKKFAYAFASANCRCFQKTRFFLFFFKADWIIKNRSLKTNLIIFKTKKGNYFENNGSVPDIFFHYIFKRQANISLKSNRTHHLSLVIRFVSIFSLTLKKKHFIEQFSC